MTPRKLSSRPIRTHAHMNLQRLRQHVKGMHRLNPNEDSVERRTQPQVLTSKQEVSEIEPHRQRKNLLSPMEHHWAY